MQALAIPQAHSLARAWPTRMPVAAQVALNATLAISLLQTTGQRSSKVWTLKPASRQTRATRSSRGVIPPLSSARLIASMPLWWTWPGA